MKKIIIALISCLISVCMPAQPGTSWSISGPVKFPTNVSGQINGIGRCTQIKFDPVAPGKMYATSASGGLWMTSDTGSTWSNVGTDYFPNMQLASICIDNTNSNILYLGTGDPNYYSGGYGVYKSTNGGTTWTPSGTGITTGLIIEIIMDPNNNQNLLAATDNGIFKSTNAGSTWVNVKNGGDFKAMVLKPNSKDTVYAVTSSQVWRSLNFGASWQQITNGVVVPNGNGLGMRLAVSGASANVVYVGMIANEGKILKSTDFGTTFSTVYNNPAQSLVGYDAVTPGQGNYNFAMTLDPLNANTVYVAAHCVWKSTDGGVTWTKLTNWYADCHTDMHGIRVHPLYNNMLFNINDGGVFLSRNGGANWITKSDNIAATEVYHAAQSNLQRNQVSIGTQDNGELFMTGNGISPGNWYTNGGGDLGSKLKYSYSATNDVYYYQNGNRRPVNGSQTSFNPPFTATNNMELEFNRRLPNVAFCALQNIYTCTNIAVPTPSWAISSSMNVQVKCLHSSLADSSVIYSFHTNNTLYRCDNIFAASPAFFSYPSPAATNVAASITSIASNINIIYASCGSNVYRSTNKGQSFTNINTGLPGGVNIIKLIHDEYSTNESVYLCTAKGVYYRNNSMSSWQNISYNLPTIADIQEFMIYNPGTAAALLRVAYYGRGVWELPINVSQPPAINFTANKQIICANTMIQFSDLSIGTPTVTSWQWSFPGGTPATSTSQNPAILYTTPGNYAVTLVAGNTNGTGTLAVQAYIQVVSPQSLPASEGFASAYPPNQWSLYDDGQDNVIWQQSTTVGGYSNSAQSTFFDNYNNDVNNKRDELITKTYNFSGVSNPVLWFDVAYARWGAGYSDSLMVLTSTNCGLSYNSVYYKGGVQLATSPDNQNLFVPTATQWRTETVNLSALAGQPSVIFAFQNRGHYGNLIYLDNINLFNSVPVDAGISAVLSPSATGCYSGAMQVIASITNYGTNPMSNVPVSVVVGGSASQTLNANYTGNIAAGATATFYIGNANMSLSGAYTLSVSTNLSGDVNTWNNTSIISRTVSPVFSIISPGAICSGNSATLSVNGTAATYTWSTGSTATNIVVSPTVQTTYSVTATNSLGCQASKMTSLSVQNPTISGIGGIGCGNTGGVISANAFSTSTINWYPSLASTVTLATGNTFTVNPPLTTSYYAEAKSILDDSLFTTLNTGSGFKGNMFNITALNNVKVTGLSLNFNSAGTVTVEVWYRPGSFIGFESSNSGWTPAYTTTLVAQGQGVLTPIPGIFAINIPAGQTYGLYVTVVNGGSQLNSTAGNTLGNLFSFNSDLQLFEGKSGSYFNVSSLPFVFNGSLHYQKDGCTSPKIPVVFTVTPLPTVSVLSSSIEICAGETATLTANGADSYSWLPGGETTASIMVTPGSTTIYTVTGTTDNCSAASTAQLVVDICTGVSAHNLTNDQINVYPNPNYGNLNIVFRHFKGNGYVFEMFDLAGKLVYKTILKKDETQLSIKELANGSYDYKILPLNGNDVIKAGKLVKQ